MNNDLLLAIGPKIRVQHEKNPAKTSLSWFSRQVLEGFWPLLQMVRLEADQPAKHQLGQVERPA